MQIVLNSFNLSGKSYDGEPQYTALDRHVNEIVDLNDSAGESLAELRREIGENERLVALLENFATRFETARRHVENIPIGLVLMR